MAFLVGINYFIGKISIYLVLKFLVWHKLSFTKLIIVLILIVFFWLTKNRPNLNGYSIILRLVYTNEKVPFVDYDNPVLKIECIRIPFYGLWKNGQ